MDLNNPTNRKKLAKQIIQEIDNFCADFYDDGPRSHLGASLIGHECARYLWNTFRWVAHKKFSGRMQRLFNRGHREEARFIEWLRGVGFEVSEFHDEELAKTDKGKAQYRISAVNGHMGGSLDGLGKFPKSYNINEPLLFEFKTSATGKHFNELVEKGVQIAKPQHFAQMSTCGRKHNVKFAVYMCINKNDDDLHVEVVALDWKLAEELEEKARMIIESQEPPAKLAQSIAYHKCKWCDYGQVCHDRQIAKIDVNCRSCKYARPIENAEWYCDKWKATIPKEAIKDGCPEWFCII